MRKLWQQAQINLLLTSLTFLVMLHSRGAGVNVLGAQTIAAHTSLPASSSRGRGRGTQQLLTNRKTSATTTRRTTYEEFTNAITILNTFNKLPMKQRKADAIIHQKAPWRHKPHDLGKQEHGEISEMVNISRERNKMSFIELYNRTNNNNGNSNNDSNIVSRYKNNNEIYYSVASNRLRRSVFHVRWNPNEKFVVESREKPAVNHSKLSPHPRWALSKITKLTLSPKLYVCHDHFSDRCHNKTAAFRQYIVDTFEKSVSEAANETNFYHVDFKPLFGDSFEEQYYPSACLVMEAGLRVLKRRDAPFNRLEFGKLFPKQKLFRHVKSIKTCAIVSSAGSLAGSKMGRFIDSHDIVMRFNDAPTRGFEVDVGSKTTIRVLNSQVVTKDEFEFTHAPIFQNITIAAWDPGKYNATLGDWLTSADYDLFTNYEIYRRRYPKSRAFLVHPHSVWRLWQSLQMFAGNRSIRKNPPSSGFIGLALLLPHCPYVDFIEYMPSTRLNGRCHYYSKEMNSACTFGAWHPLAAEKLMALDMNIADDMSVFQFGLLRIRRPDKLLCGFNFLGY